MTAYPVEKVTPSAFLNGQKNGRLDANILAVTPGHGGSPDVTLLLPAARCWRAMSAAALKAGIVLTVTSAADSYRRYAQQEAIFRERYTTTRLKGRPSKVWLNRRWWQKPGTAVAAVPGTSNHGLGGAVDLHTTQATIEWLRVHAAAYGWSWEVQSEPWHLHYFTGDKIPSAVLIYEHPPTTPPPAPGDDDMPQAPYSLWRFSDGDAVFRVAADGQSAQYVKSPAILKADEGLLALGGFDHSTHVATPRTPQQVKDGVADFYGWLRAIVSAPGSTRP